MLRIQRAEEKEQEHQRKIQDKAKKKKNAYYCKTCTYVTKRENLDTIIQRCDICQIANPLVQKLNEDLIKKLEEEDRKQQENKDIKEKKERKERRKRRKTQEAN